MLNMCWAHSYKDNSRKCDYGNVIKDVIKPEDNSETSHSLTLCWYDGLRHSGRMEMNPELITSFIAIRVNNIYAMVF